VRSRVFIQDARGADRHLRVTWHAEAGQFNVTTWHGDVCSGSVRVRADDAPVLIAALADGMADALASAQQQGAVTPTAPTAAEPRWRAWLHRLRRSA
jgi:hypothetical protein